MKITFLKYSLTSGGGISNLFLNLADKFTEAGHDVRLITSASWKPVKNLDKLNIINKPIINSFSFIKAAVRRIKEVKTDFCFVFWHPSDLAALLAKEIHKTPYITIFQGIVPSSAFSDRTFRMKMWLDRVKISHHITLKSAKVVIAISNYMKRVLNEEFGVSNTLRIYNGIDLEKFNPIIDGSTIRNKYKIDDVTTLLYLGRLDSPKGLEFLIKALTIIRRKWKDIKLLIAGRGPLENKIKKYVNKLKLQNSIKLLGYVPADILPNLYALCDIFVFPTLWEGFGLPPLEAMACGKPVIATNVCSIPEIVDNCGILVPPRDENALANAILTLIEDEKLRLKLGRLSRKRAENFDIKNTIRRYLYLLDHLETQIL